MKLLTSLLTGWLLLFASAASVHAHTEGATLVHEISAQSAPTAKLEVQRDPTGGFNVRVLTTNHLWKPESASMAYVAGQGHAHVYFDGVKIMRIYNEWFHLNLFQFANKPGEQLLTVELVANDHAPYTSKGLPIGAEQLVNVLSSDLAPKENNRLRDIGLFMTGAALSMGGTTALFLISRRKKPKE
jgi:hypothetical protein